MKTTTMELRRFVKEESERVLGIANARIEELKHVAENSTCYGDIYNAIHAIDELEERVHMFKGDIPDDSWEDYSLKEHIKYFVERADSVLSKCK